MQRLPWEEGIWGGFSKQKTRLQKEGVLVRTCMLTDTELDVWAPCRARMELACSVLLYRKGQEERVATGLAKTG